MNKYKISRKEWLIKYGYDVNCSKAEEVEDLLATTTPKEECLHDHLCCPGDIKTVRCAYCGKSMYQEPKAEHTEQVLDMIEPIKMLPNFGKEDATYLMYKELNKRFKSINKFINLLNNK